MDLGSRQNLAMTVAATPTLVPYLPRIVLEWARSDPEARWSELEGTMAFVDISGFTAMSERLARAGKAGAEELTGVMNGAFEPLLDVAYAEGGGLLKFGGDALLLFFDGDDHASRAARAAVGMRRTLRSLGRPRTSAGAVSGPRSQVNWRLASCRVAVTAERQADGQSSSPSQNAHS